MVAISSSTSDSPLWNRPRSFYIAVGLPALVAGPLSLTLASLPFLRLARCPGNARPGASSERGSPRTSRFWCTLAPTRAAHPPLPSAGRSAWPSRSSAWCRTSASRPASPSPCSTHPIGGRPPPCPSGALRPQPEPRDVLHRRAPLELLYNKIPFTALFCYTHSRLRVLLVLRTAPASPF